MGRAAAAAIAALVVLALGSPALGDVGATIERVEARALPDEELEPARETLRAAMDTPADSGRLRMALAMVEVRLDRGSKARDLARRAVKMDPDNAQLHYMRGEICFSTIDGASMLSKGAIAGAGRKSFERAIELDPTHLSAHIGLARFYIGAPGFAGGSLEKAEDVGRRVQELEGGAVEGGLIIASVRARRDDWAGALAALDGALAAADEADLRRRVVTEGLRLAYFVVEDPALAAALVDERYADDAAPMGDSADWIAGRALADLGRHGEAIERFRSIIDRVPEAGSTRYYLAASLEAEGATEEARRWYESYLEARPKGDLAKDAKRALERLR
jgi:tetratricopeptide (TPR) repeat protein